LSHCFTVLAHYGHASSLEDIVVEFVVLLLFNAGNCPRENRDCSTD